MRRTIGILFLTLIGMGLMDLTPAQVTHEEIRGTILSLINSYNQLDNKLERHEHRERALGELLKKAMQALQKGQKSLEPINGIFARLDERVSQIETMLITQEDKYNIQTEKLGEALEHVFKWMRENDECYKRPPGSVASNPTVAAATTVAVSNDFIAAQMEMNKELTEQMKKLSANVEKLLDTSKGMMQQTEVAISTVPATVEKLTNIQDKLVSYNFEPIRNVEFETQVLEKFSKLQTEIDALHSLAPTKAGLTSVDKEFIQNLANETLNALEHVKIDALSASDKALGKTTSRIKETEENLQNNLVKVFDGVSDSAETLEKFYNEMNSSYSKLNEGLEIFNKFNNILMTNSEYVLDTQRKVEFGTLQIVQKISDLLDKQREEVSALVKQRFDNVDESIVSHQVMALQNLSSLVESEISHVWRQIEIMHSEITDSKDLLTLMHGRNEVYVNSTFSTMDTMGNKVEQIKGRMLDMDSNLNFLLGKLSVMSQEFNNIKLGLAESLEELRHTFQNMQKELPARGPGPHNIDKNQYETELNLLQKRHTL